MVGSAENRYTWLLGVNMIFLGGGEQIFWTVSQYPYQFMDVKVHEWGFFSKTGTKQWMTFQSRVLLADHIKASMSSDINLKHCCGGTVWLTNFPPWWRSHTLCYISQLVCVLWLYFTVRPNKFKSLFELKTFTLFLDSRDMITSYELHFLSLHC